MQDKSNSGFGGASIKPSARPSIRRYRESRNTAYMDWGAQKGALTEPKMQYERIGRTSSPKNTSQGMDQVDGNCQSKLYKASSPKPVKPTNPRKKSLDASRLSDDSDETSDDEKLAKSLPTYLPSHSYSSNDWQSTPNTSNEQSNQRDKDQRWRENSQSNSRQILGGAQRSFNDSLNYNRHTHSPESSQRSFSDNAGTTGTGVSIRLCLIVLIIAVLACWTLKPGLLKMVQGIFESKENYDEINFINDLDVLRAKYSIDGESMLQVQTGISSIVEMENAGSFIFVYDSKMINFDENEFQSFMNAIAFTAARFLRNESTPAQPIIVDGSDFDMKTYSELIRRYREDFHKTGVMLVQGIDRVPSHLAMAFHHYCDEYNPLAKKSAVFFTLDKTKCSNISEKQQIRHSHIEKCLMSKWTTVPEFNIKPLLTRVVDIIIEVTKY